MKFTALGVRTFPERDVVIRRPPLALIVTNVGTLDLNLLIMFYLPCKSAT